MAKQVFMPVLVSIRESNAVDHMTESILWAQPVFQQYFNETRNNHEKVQRPPEVLSYSRWGFAMLDLKDLARRTDEPLSDKARQLFVEASRMAYQEVQNISPNTRLNLPTFLSITNQQLREQVAVYYVDEAA